MTNIKGIICRVCLAVAMGAVLFPAKGENPDKGWKEYLPEVHGVLRSRYELSTQTGEGRFQVRNFRFRLNGNIGSAFDYFAQVDFCDRGSIKPLDFWGRFKVWQGISLQAGQFSMPCGLDINRAPINYIFTNRSFIGKYHTNYRAVGFKVMWQSQQIPLLLEAGMFNPTPIESHIEWTKEYAYAARATYQLKNVKLTAGFQSIRPGGVRANNVDAAVSWSANGWIVEGEYVYRHTTNDLFKPCHAYNLFGSYQFPVKMGYFDHMSVQARVDGTTDYSSAIPDAAGVLKKNLEGCNRITGGVTVSHLQSKTIYVDVRLNYEKYLYNRHYDPASDGSDKLSLELVARF